MPSGLDLAALQAAVVPIVEAVSGVSKVVTRLGVIPPWVDNRQAFLPSLVEIIVGRNGQAIVGAPRIIEARPMLYVHLWMFFSGPDGESAQRFDLLWPAVQEALTNARTLGGSIHRTQPAEMTVYDIRPYWDEKFGSACHFCRIEVEAAKDWQRAE
jgi:hypothetical protein